MRDNILLMKSNFSMNRLPKLVKVVHTFLSVRHIHCHNQEHWTINSIALVGFVPLNWHWSTKYVDQYYANMNMKFGSYPNFVASLLISTSSFIHISCLQYILEVMLNILYYYYIYFATFVTCWNQKSCVQVSVQERVALHLICCAYSRGYTSIYNTPTLSLYTPKMVDNIHGRQLYHFTLFLDTRKML